MSFINSGFTGRRGRRDERLPPGQTLVEDWPVLSAGPTPQVSTADWTFTITTEDGAEHRWTWDDLTALGIEDVTTDIHCVTHWSKLAMPWRGVPLDAFFADVDTSADYAMAHCHGGYTTNVPLEDLLDGKAWVAVEAEGEPLTPEHGGPARLLVPHLYFWKSAKWLRGLQLMPDNDPGFWEQHGYHLRGDPWQEERYW
ncbi:sulfite oxidase-like oxidoreductase [Desertihabitans brevis]|uniref:Sulfite oxidase-like oxidoreductase n=1 Tax=Desertihabitans brevis TaxID=2268447 RepID=A0A367YWK0_9ACTN|nr:sulfite oxidase-like oxidoreductase [Desertihabitans brevis]RCK70276.1 sulfite oxidase-like oxidoreductase [Desertihabitans brevis]